MSNLYRNESLIQMETYETDLARADALVHQIRSKWALLRDRGLAGDYPVEILRSGGINGGNGGAGGGGNGGSRVKVVEIYRWRSQQARVDARKNPEYQELARGIDASRPPGRPRSRSARPSGGSTATSRAKAASSCSRASVPACSPSTAWSKTTR